MSRAYLEDIAKEKDVALIQKPCCYSTRLQLETRSAESVAVLVSRPLAYVVASSGNRARNCVVREL